MNPRIGLAMLKPAWVRIFNGDYGTLAIYHSHFCIDAALTGVDDFRKQLRPLRQPELHNPTLRRCNKYGGTAETKRFERSRRFTVFRPNTPGVRGHFCEAYLLRKFFYQDLAPPLKQLLPRPQVLGSKTKFE